MCCNSVNAQTMGMVADRVFFDAAASVTASGTTVTITGAFASGDVGKTLVLYNAIPTDFPSSFIWGPYNDYTDLTTNAPQVTGRAYKVTDTGRFYMWEPTCASFVLLKEYESKAVTITGYTDANTVTVDYTFPVSLSSLDAVMGTDNFSTLEDIIDDCIDNNQALCIPNGDYLILFNDSTKQRINLAKGSSSDITICGESKEKTRLFYEYETEIINGVFGLSINNTAPATDDHSASVNTLQVIAPGYAPKLLGFQTLTNNTSTVTNVVNSHIFLMTDGDLELNSVIIDGGELKNTSVAVGFDSSSPATIYYKIRNLKITDSYIARAFGIGISVQGDRPVVNVSDTTLYDIALGSGEFCRSYGAAVYMDHQTSYSFRNVTFDSCYRHAFQLYGGGATTKPTYYQELINCKFFNSGEIFTDTSYDNAKIIGCEINDNSGVVVGNSCLIASTTFIDGTSGISVTQVNASGIMFNINVTDCRFIRKAAFSFAYTTLNPYFLATFDNCWFEGKSDSTNPISFIQLSGKQNLVVRDSHVKGIVNRFLFVDGDSKVTMENNLIESSPVQYNIVADGNLLELGLINNRFIGTKQLKLSANITYTQGGQVTGYGNYFSVLNVFDNLVATAGTPYYQKLLGRQGYYPTTASVSDSDSFLDEVNFNYDFYKLTRTGTNTNPANIDYIAFNNLSSLASTGKGLFCGLVRIMAVHDPGTDGDIVIKDGTGNIHTSDGNDYTMKQNEVLEFYYDSDTLFWNMVR